MFLNLAKGQEELKALITNAMKKKKKKKPLNILNMGRKFRGPVKRAQDIDISLDEDDERDKDGKSVKTEKSNHGSEKFSFEEEEDYLDEQYPLLVRIISC